MKLSQRVNAIKPSPTTSISAKAILLQEQGVDIISLSCGEPDFDTPEHIKQAAIQAMAEGKTKYTAVEGTTELKLAIQTKFKRENNLSYELDQIIASAGGKHSIFNALAVLVDNGDEVIIPAPYWVSYPDITLMMGGKPVYINTTIKSRFKITPAQLRAAITAKTKLLILNSPSNPTGSAYSRAELAALAEVLLDHPQVFILSDDIYEHILWTEEKFSNIVNACPDLMDRTIVMNGVSKAYAMTGWRLGYVGGPLEIVKAMKKLQSQSTSCPCSISQAAATAALNGDQSFIQTLHSVFKQRHDYFIPALNTIEGIHCEKADGAFYAFANVEALIKRLPGINNDLQLTEMLMEKSRVAVVPGSAFGLAGYIRLSYATSMEDLERAIAQLQQTLNT